jgi:outer membrane protein assembly factor BamB
MPGEPPRTRRRTAAVVLAAAVLAGAALAAAAVWPGSRDAGVEPAGPRGPQRIEVLRPATGLGGVIAAFGDVWLDDRAGDRLLRLHADDGRVVAGIPVQGRLALAAGAGGVWALESSRGFGGYMRGPVVHIDPRTNRVRARIALRSRSGERLLGLGLYVHDRRVWVWGPRDVLRIDPRTDRVVQRIRVDDAHGDVAGLVVRGRRLIAATADGTFLALDARTGAVRRAVATPFGAPSIRASVGAQVIVTSRGELAALQPLTGRVSWRRRLGFRAGAVARAHGLLWVHSAALNEPGDRLSGFDPATGEMPTTSILPAFGTTGLVAVGSRLLVPSSTGRLLMISPLLL